ncbi:AAA family ATPase [Thermopolyspora sp. NPDC052614]|uniref:AAA family ATPase n=1 Tax=Thermopolyspora sp. NPDC052614 TaxID=3155682 RepID=UPI003448FC4B
MTIAAKGSPVVLVDKIRIRGYRSIAECDVPLGPLTVLVGFNAAGKSNFLDALRFTADALAASPGHALSVRGGLERVLHHGPATSEAVESFSIELDLELPANETGEAKPASYKFEIGRASSRRSSPMVLREECHIKEPDGGGKWFAVSPEGFTSSSSLSTPELAERRPRDRLLLQAVSVFDKAFQRLQTALTSMRFYEFDTTVLRRIDDDTERHTTLGPRGEHIGHVLGTLAETMPTVKEHLDSYLRAVVPQLLGVDERREEEFSTIRARFWNGDPALGFWEAVNSGKVYPPAPHVDVFQRQELSEGTLRAAGVLAALFQPGVRHGSIPLVAIEEPETAIHPAKVAALYDALEDASAHTQVIATTQSADILDTEYAKAEHLRLVEMVNGVTRIGELDEHTRQYLAEQPSMLAAMHRQGHLRPADHEQGRR